MARAAGSSHAYTFKLKGTRKGDEYTLDFPSVTHVLKSVADSLGFGAMAWWGYKIGIRALNPELDDDDIGELYEAAKQTDWTPNKVRDEAGERGTGTHDLLEAIARDEVIASREGDLFIVSGPTETLADLLGLEGKEKKGFLKAGTEAFEPVGYQEAGVRWWLDQTDQEISFAERPVWSVRHGFGGTLDLAREVDNISFEIVDYKTHKPAPGARKDGTYRDGEGPAYIDDLLQLAGYRQCVEELGFGRVTGTRVVLLGPDGFYYEDTRTVPAQAFLNMKAVHDDVCRKAECLRMARAYGAYWGEV